MLGTAAGHVTEPDVSPGCDGPLSSIDCNALETDQDEGSAGRRTQEYVHYSAVDKSQNKYLVYWCGENANVFAVASTKIGIN